MSTKREGNWPTDGNPTGRNCHRTYAECLATPDSLLTHKFWVQAIYSVGSEPGGARTEAAATGLVKILRLPNDGKAQQRHERKTRISLVLFGASCWVDSMFVWFPAAWVPFVVMPSGQKMFGGKE